MKLVHYSQHPVTSLKPVVQVDQHSRFGKPNGFWVSVETEDGWHSWCTSEGFNLERITCVHDVELDVTDVLQISRAEELDDFTHKFSAPLSERFAEINWQSVTAHYKGILIVPYIWERRLHHDYSWYYGWDCASGCIWDVGAIKSIILRA